MELTDELSEALAKKVEEKQETVEWVPYLGPDGGEGWQISGGEEVRYQENPPGDVAEGYDEDHWNDASDFQERMSAEEIEEVFSNVYADEHDYKSVDHAATRLVLDGKADPQTVADVLIEREDGMSGELWTTQGRIAAEEIGGHTSGPTKWGMNMPLVTDDAGWQRKQAIREFRDDIAWGPHISEIVRDGVNEWKLGMFSGECAPMFQLAADITGNETLPEGGAHGDDDEIPSVMEMSVAYEDKEAFEAKMEQSQEILREAFGDTITVYRGISPAQGNPTYAEPSRASDKLAEAKDMGDPAVHQHRPIESWTTNAQYASRYAKGMAQGNPEEGVMLKKEVPVERTMISSHTSNLSRSESEVIVIHDEEWVYQPDEIMKAREITDRWLIEEALKQAEEQRDLSKQDIPDHVDPEADSTVYISADEINPKWLHEDPPGEKIGKQSGKWVPYQGPEGGEGWQNTSTQEVRYQQDPPGEVEDGYNEDYWNEQNDVGYHDEQAWGQALHDEGWTSPGDVPEGTAIEFAPQAGATATGIVEGVQWGEQFENYANDPASLVVDDGDAKYHVGANQIIDVIDAGPEDDYEPQEFDWDTEVPRIDELQEEADVLYMDNTGVRRVGTYERPEFVETPSGTYPGMVLDNGDEIRLQQIIAVDEGPVPVEPREDPHEYNDYVDPHQRGFQDPGITWNDALEYTPFDHPGQVPIGVTVEIDASNHPDATGVNGLLEGEVVGYWEGDAEINEPNGLEVEVPEHGKMIVFPDELKGFIGPEGEVNTAQYLSDPFSHAKRVSGSREAGIGDGNTTGARMKVLTMPDDSRVFATPLNAYNNISTGVVSGSQEARRNNLNSPIMIEHLGGNACKTEVVEDDSGEQYIAKEGIEGDLLKSVRWEIDDAEEHEELRDDLEETLAAAFFVGNGDLHGANIMVNLETQEATIIDHDNAGPFMAGGWHDIYRFARGPADTANVEQKVYEICRDYMKGETDVPEELQGSYHEDHFMMALDSVINDTDHQDLFDPWESSSHESIDGFETMDSFEPEMEVTVLSENGRVRRGVLTDQYKGEWYGETEDNHEIHFDKPQHVLEIHGDKADYGPDYVISDFEPGDTLTADPNGLGEEEVVVDELDEQWNRLRVHPEGDPEDVFHVGMDEIATADLEEGDSQ